MATSTKINVKHIKIIVLNCRVFNTTPSLYNLGGMGSFNSYALVMSTEIVSFTWHSGNDAMLYPPI
ncbi:hypothetical protein CARUB_v10018598mg, partial [Capsella rubella]